MIPAAVTVRFDELSLEELNARAALLTRFDRKYIVDQRTLGAFADAIARDFLVLEIDTRRVFTYETARCGAIPGCRSCAATSSRSSPKTNAPWNPGRGRA